mgnify:CR=1 FL=1
MPEGIGGSLRNIDIQVCKPFYILAFLERYSRQFNRTHSVELSMTAWIVMVCFVTRQLIVSQNFEFHICSSYSDDFTIPWLGVNFPNGMFNEVVHYF